MQAGMLASLAYALRKEILGTTRKSRKFPLTYLRYKSHRILRRMFQRESFVNLELTTKESDYGYSSDNSNILRDGRTNLVE